MLYMELKALASRAMRGERAGHTLQTTALVNEACLRVLGQHQLDMTNRAQFLGLAAQMMRRVLVDHARRNMAAKRPAPNLRVDIAEIDAPEAQVDFLGLDEALERLADINARQAQVVDLKFFAGAGVGRNRRRPRHGTPHRRARLAHGASLVAARAGRCLRALLATVTPGARAIVHEVLERAPDARAAYLDAQCGGSTALRREVEWLIAAADDARAGRHSSPSSPPPPGHWKPTFASMPARRATTAS